jgi:hypothetical protein
VLAVLFSLLLTLYLIIPEAIFRAIFGWYVPPRNFVFTRVDTAYRALLVAVLPLAFALAASWYLPVVETFPFPVKNNTAELRRSDYREVLSALYSEPEFRNTQKEFWPAFTRCARRQVRLISWYLLAIMLEAWAAGALAANYARYKKYWVYNWLADKFLFSYISEWHPLLTPYLFEEGTTVQAEILCTNGTLYQGVVSHHFVKDGALTGIFLAEPRRFSRERYVKDRDTNEKTGIEKPHKNEYWQEIPSQNLYFFADKIFNMNLNYRAPAGRIGAEAVRKLLVKVLGTSSERTNITVTQEEPAAKPKQ